MMQAVSHEPQYHDDFPWKRSLHLRAIVRLSCLDQGRKRKAPVISTCVPGYSCC
jgi:hypothetical protein